MMLHSRMAVIQRFAVLILVFAGASASADPVHRMPRCGPMQLPIAEVGARPTQYEDFCQRHPDACILGGEAVFEWDPEIHQVLNDVNIQVNDEVELVSDLDNHGVVEDWSFPQECRGDCEDFALEKRERLVDAGFPRASLTIAFAFHEVHFFPHAVLLVETTSGTWVLDNLYDEVLCWDAVPYRFTRREQPDGTWVRFSPW